MKVFRAEVIRTEKADDDWPFFTITFVIFAKDDAWAERVAERIAEDTIGLIEIQRGAYGSMRIDNITEITVSGM